MNNLKIYRQSLSLTGKEMADILQSEEYKIYKIERNERKNNFLWQAYLSYLGITSEQALTEDEKIKSNTICKINKIKIKNKAKIYIENKSQAIKLQAYLTTENINISIKKSRYYFLDVPEIRECSKLAFDLSSFEELKL